MAIRTWAQDCGMLLVKQAMTRQQSMSRKSSKKSSETRRQRKRRKKKRSWLRKRKETRMRERSTIASYASELYARRLSTKSPRQNKSSARSRYPTSKST